jgi:hypothetical protein
VCGKRIDMSPNGDDHKAMVSYMKEHGWGGTQAVTDGSAMLSEY